MIIYIHTRTTHTEDTLPQYIKRKFYLSGLIIYALFMYIAYQFIFNEGMILSGIVLAVLVSFPTIWIFLSLCIFPHEYAEIWPDKVVLVTPNILTSYVLWEKEIYTDLIDHAKLIPAYSLKLKGMRACNFAVKYIAFFDRDGKQLFKLIAYKEALDFAESVTEIIE